MKKESTLYAIIGLLAGLLIAGSTAVLAVNNDAHSIMNMMGMNTDHSHREKANSRADMSMNEMSQQLESLSGYDYDQAFIEIMIDHHVGAIDMAKLSDTRARHDEIKLLSKAIMSAQEREIYDMKQWQYDWGYPGVMSQ